MVSALCRALALAGLGVGILGVLSAAPALADNGPHVAETASTTTDKCASCHRTHTAPAAGLLLTDVTDLCKTCHSSGTGALTDPWAGWSYPDFFNTFDMMGLRGGGFTTAALDTTAATITPTKTIPSLVNTVAPATSGHSYDRSLQTSWGGGTTGLGPQIRVTCTSCHNPHGNGNYRILRPLAKGGAGTEVTISDATRKTYITFNYWNPQDTFAPEYITKVSTWCIQCHTRYESNDASLNTGDPVYTFRHKSVDTTPGSPNCIQCHVAHGSNSSMAGTYSSQVPLPGGAPAPAGDSRLLRMDNRGICQMCHNA
jgi:predicted CXXCH cytochrome family protein